MQIIQNQIMIGRFDPFLAGLPFWSDEHLS